MFFVLRALTGYSEVASDCIACDSVQPIALTVVLLVALLLVYLVHRLPDDWSGAAVLNIVSYFIQTALLFSAADSLPSIFSLANFDLLGDHKARGMELVTAAASGRPADAWCVVPLSSAGHVWLLLASPLVSLLLLGVIAFVQFIVNTTLQLISAASLGKRKWLYELVFMPVVATASQSDRVADEQLVSDARASVSYVAADSISVLGHLTAGDELENDETSGWCWRQRCSSSMSQRWFQ
jgi:hypothetical protein